MKIFGRRCTRNRISKTPKPLEMRKEVEAKEVTTKVAREVVRRSQT